MIAATMVELTKQGNERFTGVVAEADKSSKFVTCGHHHKYEDLAAVVGYSEQEWRDEVPRIGRWFDTFGWRLPRELVDELVNLEIALDTRRDPAED